MNRLGDLTNMESSHFDFKKKSRLGHCQYRQAVRRLVDDKSFDETANEQGGPSPRILELRRARRRASSHSCSESETQIEPRLTPILARRPLSFSVIDERKNRVEMTVNSENEKTEADQMGSKSHGESDVWRIIQSRTPEPLPNSEPTSQEKENVSRELTK